jgi:hypothetical protein
MNNTLVHRGTLWNKLDSSWFLNWLDEDLTEQNTEIGMNASVISITRWK